MSVATYPGFPANNYDPLYFQVDGSVGCTLTRAVIRPFTKSDFSDQGLKEVGMDRTIANAKEARMAGIQANYLTDLLLSRQVALRNGGGVTNGSIVAPYTLIPRRNQVNIGYWLITGGSSTQPGDPATAFPTDLPATAYYLTVTASSGGYGTALKQIDKYFMPGMYLYAESTARYTGAAWQSYIGGGNIDSNVSVQYRVVGAVMKSGSETTAYIVVAPTEFQSKEASASAWATYKADTSGSPSPAALVDYTLITKGLLLILANSVSDYESWCYQPPAINNRTLIEYWHQTSRWTHQYNDEYLKALSAPLTSDFFKKFRSLPIVEQRRQQEALAEKAFYDTVFYGGRLSDKQSISTYTDLPVVEDLTNPGCSIEYKANTIGIRNQLGENSRVVDYNGAALNLDTFFEQMYTLKRTRSNNGTNIETIDLMTDRFTKSKLRDAMIRYYKAKYGTDVTIFLQQGQKLVDSVTNRLVFEYDKFDLPDQGVSLAVYHNTYFDDRIGAAPAMGASSGTKNRARQIWAVDWSDIELGIHGTRSVKRQTNVADNLYNCTITQNVNHYMLNSKKFEVRVGDTNRHLVLENFADSCPSVTVSMCNPTTS